MECAVAIISEVAKYPPPDDTLEVVQGAQVNGLFMKPRLKLGPQPLSVSRGGAGRARPVRAKELDVPLNRGKFDPKKDAEIRRIWDYMADAGGPPGSQ